MRNLIVFASHEGQTEQIAERIHRRLLHHRMPSDVLDVVQHSATEIQVEAYDAVLVGSPMHFGRHDPRIRFFIEHNLDFLNEIPTAFFSVSLASASKKRKERAEAERLANEFLQSTLWNPPVMDCFAGALKYSKYGWLKRQIMHRIAQRAGAETDFDQDYDYTDWERVDDFADRFATLVRACRRPPEQRPRFSELRTPVREYSLHRTRSKRRTANLYHVVANGGRLHGWMSRANSFRCMKSPLIGRLCAKRSRAKVVAPRATRKLIQGGPILAGKHRYAKPLPRLTFRQRNA
ncbi:protoporphyrinogen oxidase [Rhodopirellula islandica]|uniref:Protoporphyrinogen oxidase n=1 Tax=Rhodopirellula islandica TaxID=595434 RepID=A0A0J1BG88_RHOIS|nr:menaquinone-dependent protoporphyrinogen IX dehydrogenase [Rhodopirellula islandica]KLU05560.1 protoporphyrinogen oxidase [Rhodopirellula islandica]